MFLLTCHVNEVKVNECPLPLFTILQAAAAKNWVHEYIRKYKKIAAICILTLVYTGVRDGQALLHCTALYCTVIHCNELHCSSLYWTVLHWTLLHCTKLYYTSHWTVLYCTALHCTGYNSTLLYSTEVDWTCKKLCVAWAKVVVIISIVRRGIIPACCTGTVLALCVTLYWTVTVLYSTVLHSAQYCSLLHCHWTALYCLCYCTALH